MCTEPESNAAASNGAAAAPQRAAASRDSPYQTVQDYLSNIGNFKIIESTLREGEQFANAFFDTGAFVRSFPPPIDFVPRADQLDQQKPRSRCAPAQQLASFSRNQLEHD